MVGSASARFAAMPSHTTRLNQRPAVVVAMAMIVSSRSEGLQVLDDGRLVGVRKGGAVLVSPVAVTRDRRVVQEEAAAALLRHRGDEPDALGVEDVVPAVEGRWTPRRFVEQR